VHLQKSAGNLWRFTPHRARRNMAQSIKASQTSLSVKNSDFIRNIQHRIQDVRQMEALNVRVAIFDAICHQQVVTISQQSAGILDVFTILGRNWNFGFAWVCMGCHMVLHVATCCHKRYLTYIISIHMISYYILLSFCITSIHIDLLPSL
jgi:hypothetical protein